MSARRVWLPTHHSSPTTEDQPLHQSISNPSFVPSRGSGRGRDSYRGHRYQRNSHQTAEANVLQQQQEDYSEISEANEPVLQNRGRGTRNVRKKQQRKPNVGAVGVGMITDDTNAEAPQSSILNQNETKSLQSGSNISAQKYTGKKNKKLQQLPNIYGGKEEVEPTQNEVSVHSDLAQETIERLNKNSYECIICCDVIKRHVSVWTCNQCHMLFHIYCIKKWSKTSDGESAKSSNISWRCPGCQFVHLSKPVPKCFCEKVVDPQFDPYILPHSCGEVCGKSRSSNCPHPCPMLCHPGFCPPCGAWGPEMTCYCGAEHYRLRCGEKNLGKSCGNLCGKKLNCGVHRCNEICHPGSCGRCLEKEIQICYCEKVKEERLCGSGTLNGEIRQFSCNKICDKILDCGNHKCESICHLGSCEPCKLLPRKVNSCPCGKIPLSLLTNKIRTSCTDPVVTCPNLCEKKLSCGLHSCKNKCHNGPCADCTEEVKIPCRCHTTMTPVVCSKANSPEFKDHPILCNKSCKALKTCGRHPCKNKCCPSSLQADPQGFDSTGAHICNLICDKTLKCGKHKCDLLCHSGRCPPCHITSHEPYICECGKTMVEPPILCGNKLPECHHPCVRERPCGHRDNHNCHSRDSACPPCPFLVEKMCVGNHEMRKNVRCSAQEVSCGRLCGKNLSCGNHKCRKSCHSGPCLEQGPNGSTDNENAGCGFICGEKLTLCNHSCQAKCHPGKPCPKVPCKQKITITCACKRRSMESECLRGGEDDFADKKQPQLPCDELCVIEERAKKLAEAFGPATYSINSIFPDLLIQLSKASISFILQIEKAFEELIKGSSPRHYFPPMDRLQRRIVHELAKCYSLDTESCDREPYRSVVVTKKKDSKIPPVLLSASVVDAQNRDKQQSVVNISQQHNTLCALHIYDLSPEIKTHHLTSLLQPFEGYYQLRWLDEFNALVLFKDANRMRSALYILQGRFHVEQYKDHYGPEEGGGECKNIREKITQKSRLHEVKQFEPAWQQNNNYFAALTGQPLENPINLPTQTISSKEKMWGTEEELLFKKDVAPNLDVTTPHQVIQEMDSKSVDDWESVVED